MNTIIEGDWKAQVSIDVDLGFIVRLFNAKVDAEFVINGVMDFVDLQILINRVDEYIRASNEDCYEA